VPTAKTYIPGQALLGSKVEPAPMAFGSTVTFLGGPLSAAGNVPTVALAAGIGTVGSVAAQVGYDMAGAFNMVAGTASSTGGTLAVVTFGQPLAATPSAVVVTAAANTGTVAFPVGAQAVSKTGFSIWGGNPSSGGTYSVNYVVFR
jgi:hypothetical protein